MLAEIPCFPAFCSQDYRIPGPPLGSQPLTANVSLAARAEINVTNITVVFLFLPSVFTRSHGVPGLRFIGS